MTSSVIFKNQEQADDDTPPVVRLRHVVARNVVWNWTGTAVDMVAGFIIAPLLVRRLGTTGYGLWIVIGSLTGYFSVLDLGLRGSVGRQMAFERARENHEGVNQIFSTALGILTAIGIFIAAATLIATALMTRFFDTPPELIGAARLALLLVGINLALSFPLQVFDGNLWAAQRFDILNFVDIPATIARVILTIVFVRGPHDIVTLAIITIALTLGTGTVKALVGFRHDRFLGFHLKLMNRESGKRLFGYGWWNFVLTICRMTESQLSPILIGASLGILLVTPFSIARRLQDYAHKVLWTATGVTIPVATRFHARAEITQQQNLLIEGSKYSTVVAIYFLVYFICLGGALIGLWMGRAFVYVGALLIVLAVGEFLQMTQSVTSSIIVAAARHKILAWFSVAETSMSLVLLWLLAARFGLMGVCVALSIPQVLFSGVATLFFGCRVSQIGVARYIRTALIPPFVASAVPVVVLVFLTMWMPVSSWPVLILFSAIYTITFAASCWAILKPVTAGGVLGNVRATLFSG